MKTRAFTIVEIMIVLAIGAIFLGVSIPAFRSMAGWKKKAPLIEAVENVEDVCRKARTEAILGRRVMEVYLNDVEDVVALSTAPRAVMGMDYDTGAETRQAQARKEMGRFELTADMEIIAPRSDEFDGELRLRFYPNGTAEAAEVKVFDGTGNYRLAVDPVTGQTMVENEEDL